MYAGNMLNYNFSRTIRRGNSKTFAVGLVVHRRQPNEPAE